jgi:DNA-binding NarL/FixJ family response regulator
VLSAFVSEQAIQDGYSAGAAGFVSKSDAARDLIAAVEALEHGKTFFARSDGSLPCTRTERDGGTQPQVAQLTTRERQVVQLLSQGRTTKQAAASLAISEKTAETHRSSVMRKLGFHSTSELVLYAVRNHLVPLDGDSAQCFQSSAAAQPQKAEVRAAGNRSAAVQHKGRAATSRR